MKKSIKELTAYELMLAEEEVQTGTFYSIFLRTCDDHGIEVGDDVAMGLLLTSRLLRVALHYNDVDALVTHLLTFFSRANIKRPAINQVRCFADDLIAKYVAVSTTSK